MNKFKKDKFALLKSKSTIFKLYRLFFKNYNQLQHYRAVNVIVM